eukprot:Gb_08417 [translate_table: standard]
MNLLEVLFSNEETNRVNPPCLCSSYQAKDTQDKSSLLQNQFEFLQREYDERATSSEDEINNYTTTMLNAIGNLEETIPYVSYESDFSNIDMRLTTALRKALDKKSQFESMIRNLKMTHRLETTIKKLIDVIDELLQDETLMTDSYMKKISHLKGSLLLVIEKYKASLSQLNLVQKCLVELATEYGHSWEKEARMPLDVALIEEERDFAVRELFNTDNPLKAKEGATGNTQSVMALDEKSGSEAMIRELEFALSPRYLKRSMSKMIRHLETMSKKLIDVVEENMDTHGDVAVREVFSCTEKQLGQLYRKLDEVKSGMLSCRKMKEEELEVEKVAASFRMRELQPNVVLTGLRGVGELDEHSRNMIEEEHRDLKRELFKNEGYITEAMEAKEQAEQLRVQTCQLQDELHEIEEEKMELMASECYTGKYASCEQSAGVQRKVIRGRGGMLMFFIRNTKFVMALDSLYDDCGKSGEQL